MVTETLTFEDDAADLLAVSAKLRGYSRNEYLQRACLGLVDTARGEQAADDAKTIAAAPPDRRAKLRDAIAGERALQATEANG